MKNTILLFSLVLSNLFVMGQYDPKSVIAKLDTLFQDNQWYILRMDSIERQYGQESTEMRFLRKARRRSDSLNTIEVKNILDSYGWLGPDVIGKRANETLFLVIQRSDLKTREMYLPLLRYAVVIGNASADSYACLADRIALDQGKKQIYGSQIGINEETGAYFILPLEDPENVDKRRDQMELAPLAEYVRKWHIRWGAGNALPF